MQDKSSLNLQYPEAVDMERYIIGVMMVGDSRVNCAKIFSELRTNDFFRPENCLLFDTLKAIYERGDIPNMLTAFEELRKNHLDEKIDFNYLTALPAMVSTSAYIDAYIETIRDKAAQRRLIDIARKLAVDAQAGILPVDKIQEQYLNAIGNINRNSNQFIFKSSTSMRGEIQAATADNQLYQDRSTGFANLDAHHQPFRPGLYVLGAVPAAGKTTFCWQLAEHFALSGETVFYFTFEITRVELWAKSIARHFKGYAFPPSVTRILSVPPDSDLADEARHAILIFKMHSVIPAANFTLSNAIAISPPTKLLTSYALIASPIKKRPSSLSTTSRRFTTKNATNAPALTAISANLNPSKISPTLPSLSLPVTTA